MRAVSEDGAVRVEVGDTGPGIEPEDQGKDLFRIPAGRQGAPENLKAPG